MTDTINFSTLIVSGPDALTFLQGQLTCDLRLVTDALTYGAYCNHQGRMIANFMIRKQNDEIELILPESMITTLHDALKKFAVFSKVAFETYHGTHIPVEKNKISFMKQRIAFIYPETSLLFTPQMIGWEKHGGVSFTKGCYVGQEIVARTQHLGKLKRHLHEITFEPDNINTLKPGSDLLNDKNEPIGIVCDLAILDNKLLVLAVMQDLEALCRIVWVK